MSGFLLLLVSGLDWQPIFSPALAFVTYQHLHCRFLAEKFRLTVISVKMGQHNSKEDAAAEALEEDLIRVQSVQQALRSVVSSSHTVADGHTEYTIRTTDRDGNSWETTTRYSFVVQLLEEVVHVPPDTFIQEHELEWSHEGRDGNESILSDASHVALMWHNYSNVITDIEHLRVYRIQRLHHINAICICAD